MLSYPLANQDPTTLPIGPNTNKIIGVTINKQISAVNKPLKVSGITL